MTERNNQRILVVDDHAALAANIAEVLEGVGYDVEVAGSAEAALERTPKDGPPWTAMVTDYRLPGISGAELVSELRLRGIAIPAIVVSAYTDAATLGAAEAAGAVEVLAKPFDPIHLVDLIANMIKQAHAQRPHR